MENLNLLYNKQYYDFKDGSAVVAEKANNRLINATFTAEDYSDEIVKALNPQTFCLKTVYPGLLAGIGYPHSLSVEEAAKTGFSFDYVTGQPYIPGSEIKGVLHHYLKKQAVCAEHLRNFDAEDKALHSKLLDAIFGVAEGGGTDVFLDAVVKYGDKEGKILSFDSITPHSSPIKNPIPIRILKVLPNVVFEFRFLLQDTAVRAGTKEYRITAAEKLEAFKSVLLEFGVGAKTNVGYGVLAEPSEEDFKYPQLSDKAPEQKQEKRQSTRNQSGNVYRTDKPAQRQGSNPVQQNGAYCPNCNRWNFRFNKGTVEETKSWEKGVCFSCHKLLF